MQLPPASSPVSHVTLAVLQNLQDQHDWTALEIRDGQRPLIRGLPPRRLYIHPDDQIAALALEQTTGERARVDPEPEPEWVLAVHLAEKWSLAGLAAVFDSIQDTGTRAKRIVLGTLHNDSTVVYYLIHEGMVKPRQN